MQDDKIPERNGKRRVFHGAGIFWCRSVRLVGQRQYSSSHFPNRIKKKTTIHKTIKFGWHEDLTWYWRGGVTKRTWDITSQEATWGEVSPAEPKPIGCDALVFHQREIVFQQKCYSFQVNQTQLKRILLLSFINRDSHRLPLPLFSAVFWMHSPHQTR